MTLQDVTKMLMWSRQKQSLKSLIFPGFNNGFNGDLQDVESLAFFFFSITKP